MGNGHGAKPDYLRMPATPGLSGSAVWASLTEWLGLGWEAARTAWAFRSRGWWRKSPFLPVPEPFYVRWRVYTAYGDPMKAIARADLVSFLRWRIQFSRYVKTVAA